MRHHEVHRSTRGGWLRAAVLGANDGIVSTASLLIGVASAGAAHEYVLVSGVASLIAGAMSMAAGEYVSVSSQADAERADLDLERRELESDPEYETRELAAIYVRRGLGADLARQVAERLMAVDPLAAHARDELGISKQRAARPLQAAAASFAAFSTGAALPLAVAMFAPQSWLAPAVAVASLCSLATLGGVAAHAGGAPIARGALRVTFWSALAMILTAAIGSLVGMAI